MFEDVIIRSLDRFNRDYWRIKELSIEEKKVKLLNTLKEDIGLPPTYKLIENAITKPSECKELYSYLDDFSLLNRCIKFIKQEGITLDDFNTLIETENIEKFYQEAERLLDTILTKEVEPYYALVFEVIPTREDRANALFKED